MRCGGKVTVPYSPFKIQCVRDHTHSTGNIDWHVAYVVNEDGVRMTVQWREKDRQAMEEQPCRQCG